jgi:glycosyltransferase involved in cell wall biosynthesis
MNKNRVVHIITKLELGGAQLNTIYTFEHLDPDTYDVFLISGERGLLDGDIKKKASFFNVPKLQRRIHPFKDLGAFFALKKKLKELNPVIVHTHSSKAGMIGRLAARAAKVPVIIHSVHGFSFSPYQFVLKKWFFRIMERIVSRITHWFIFVSENDIKSARRYRLCRKNFTLIRSGFPLSKFIKCYDNNDEINRKYQLSEDQIVCGILAPFKPQKGLFDLAEIADRVIRRNPKVIFFIAGDGALRAELEADLQRRNIVQNFRLPGFIHNIEEVMGRFDIGVSSALWEGLPQSLVQFRLKKKPIVATDIPGNNEVVRDGKNGFLIPVGGHREFSDRILSLAADREKIKALGNFPDDFSQWDAPYMVREQEKLYSSLQKSIIRGNRLKDFR